jgi:hypothetical protein
MALPFCAPLIPNIFYPACKVSSSRIRLRDRDGPQMAELAWLGTVESRKPFSRLPLHDWYVCLDQHPCMHACIHACMHACMHVRTHENTNHHIYMCVYTAVFTLVCMYAQLKTCMPTTHVCMSLCHILVWKYKLLSVCEHACHTSFYVDVNVLERAALMCINMNVLDIAALVCVYMKVLTLQAFMPVYVNVLATQAVVYM